MSSKLTEQISRTYLEVHSFYHFKLRDETWENKTCEKYNRVASKTSFMDCGSQHWKICYVAEDKRGAVVHSEENNSQILSKEEMGKDNTVIVWW